MNNLLGLMMGQSAQAAPLLQPTPNYGLLNFNGLVKPGNIDLNARPVVKNSDGSISTIKSMSVNMDGVEWLIPTISPDGKQLSERQAIDLFRKTGMHLGAFATPDFATAYAKAISGMQGQHYGAGK